MLILIACIYGYLRVGTHTRAYVVHKTAADTFLCRYLYMTIDILTRSRIQNLAINSKTTLHNSIRPIMCKNNLLLCTYRGNSCLRPKELEIVTVYQCNCCYYIRHDNVKFMFAHNIHAHSENCKSNYYLNVIRLFSILFSRRFTYFKLKAVLDFSQSLTCKAMIMAEIIK